MDDLVTRRVDLVVLLRLVGAVPFLDRGLGLVLVVDHGVGRELLDGDGLGSKVLGRDIVGHEILDGLDLGRVHLGLELERLVLGRVGDDVVSGLLRLGLESRVVRGALVLAIDEGLDLLELRLRLGLAMLFGRFVGLGRDVGAPVRDVLERVVLGGARLDVLVDRGGDLLRLATAEETAPLGLFGSVERLGLGGELVLLVLGVRRLPGIVLGLGFGL